MNDPAKSDRSAGATVLPARARLFRAGADPANGYGWLSILLHWTTVAVLLPLWFVGYATSHPGSGNVADLVNTHTTIALLAYPLLWLRVLWRFWQGHPGPLPRQRGRLFRLGKAVHYLLLVAIGVMLLSGPLMVWSGGNPIHVFSATLPTPLPHLSRLSGWMLSVHRAASRVILWGIVLHVAGALKQVVFNGDGTLTRMLIAGRRPSRR